MGIDPGAEVQQSRGLPDATLRGGLQVKQQQMGGIGFVQHLQRACDAVENHRQFVIEFMGGCRGNGAGAIGLRKVLHAQRVLQGQAAASRGCLYLIETDGSEQVKIVVNGFFRISEFFASARV